MPKKRKKRGFLFLGFIVSAVTIAIGVGGKVAGQVIEEDNGTRPPLPPPIVPPIPPPDPEEEEGRLFPIGTRVRVKANCGSGSGLTGIIIDHIFQRPGDRRTNDISMVVEFDEQFKPAFFRNAWRVSENCLVKI